MKLTIADILKIRSLKAQFLGSISDLDTEFGKVTIDSRKASPGDLFIAIRGERFDGHQFVDEVLRSGARAAVVKREWIGESKVTGNLIVVSDTLATLQEISNYYRRKFSFPLIAITGSNGKTTTKEMVAHVLSQHYQVLKNPGNLNNYIGVPLTLFMLADHYDMAVIEFGTSRFGEIKRLAEISEPQFGLITNIGPAHLEFFGSLQGVAAEKTDLWRYIESAKGTAFINVDDPFLAVTLPTCGEIITYGFNNKASVKGEFLGLTEHGCAEFMHQGIKFTLAVPGEHNIYNALAAIAISIRFGIELSAVQMALQSFQSTSKRMEVIKSQGILVLNDCYNSNPASAERALKTLAQIRTRGKRIAVLADMLELGPSGESHHRAIGRLAAGLKIDHVLAYGPLSHFTIEEAAINGMKNVIHFDNKSHLINMLKDIIHRNDTILIKGSRGMAMEDVTNALLSSAEDREQAN